MNTKSTRGLWRSTLVAAMAASMSLVAAGQPRDRTVAEFTAFAVNPNASAAATAGTVQIVINRWSTAAERAQLMKALQQSDADAQRDAMQTLPRIGYIRTPDTVGYELHYAHEVKDDDGGRRVFIATDRPISTWEAVNRPRTIDYPFTFIELHLGHGDTGEGKMSVATRVTVNERRNLVELENYATQPVLLQNVQERRAQER